ncbi:hypothetical protein OEA41_009727 [Lepraria neglecta]|uniref:Uncharacterized protein n=1 Tax=Lepraria neglecta TaxID=209136 RepID=A0AAD9Z2T2_9LECA|nr:hypothetical protein OEA41_009727 [Lepraria neglecta]
MDDPKNDYPEELALSFIATLHKHGLNSENMFCVADEIATEAHRMTQIEQQQINPTYPDPQYSSLTTAPDPSSDAFLRSDQSFCLIRDPTIYAIIPVKEWQETGT